MDDLDIDEEARRRALADDEYEDAFAEEDMPAGVRRGRDQGLDAYLRRSLRDSPAALDRPVDEQGFQSLIRGLAGAPAPVEPAGPTRPSAEPVPAADPQGASAELRSSGSPGASPSSRADVGGIDVRRARLEAGLDRANRDLAVSEGARTFGRGLLRMFGGNPSVLNGARPSAERAVSDARSKIDRYLSEQDRLRQERIAAQRADREAARQAILDRTNRQQQALENKQADARLAIQQQGAESLSGYRAGQLTNAQGRLELARDTQHWREQNAELERAAKMARARVAAGGGGGRGAIPMPGADLGPGVHPDTPNILNIIQTRDDLVRPFAQMLQEQAAAAGQPPLSDERAQWQAAATIWANQTDDAREDARADLARAPTATAAANANARDALLDERHVVPGWTRTENAPVLGQEDLNKAHGAAAQWDNIQNFSRQLERLASQIGPADLIAARAGVLTTTVARANNLHEQLVNAMREIGNYGVPQQAELERMQHLVPTPESLSQWTDTAANAYREMRSIYSQAVAARMRAWGYSPGDGGGGGARRAVVGQPIQLRNGVTVTPQTEAQAARINQALGVQ